MAFRKRNIGLSRASRPSDALNLTDGHGQAAEVPAILRGTRPSPLTGQPTTSTGAYSLDSLLGGHAGLAMGSSLFIEENGTTDFAGALLRYYAAEGLVQGHMLHVVGVGEQWVRELPGLVGAARETEEKGDREGVEEEEEEEEGSRTGPRSHRHRRNRWKNLVSRSGRPSILPHVRPRKTPHQARKRLRKPHAHLTTAGIFQFSLGSHLPVSVAPPDQHPSTTVHRLIIPTILSPALYPPQAAHPQHFLRFLHSLRSLLRQHPTRLTAMLTLPLSLYPRSSGLVRWAETLCDGVVELTPFPHLMDSSNSLAESGGSRGNEEQPQGMLKLHKLPVSTERGGGGGGGEGRGGEDMAFTLSRRKFVIKPFSLPPMEGDTEAQRGRRKGGAGEGKQSGH
ncbi:Elongator subunit elp4 [Taxawa tesnikishii (nom. ined.)]|nr:Elongator subunit elp4 [Dothideales sp. JES 119]